VAAAVLVIDLRQYSNPKIENGVGAHCYAFVDARLPQSGLHA
jgi:hypothetical protein